jgi:hypothetical protein
MRPLEPVPRDPAASEAAHELSKKVYRDEQPSLLTRAVDWVWDHVREFLDRASDAAPGGRIGLLLLVVAVAVVVGVLIWRFGAPGRSARVRPGADAVTPTRTAVEHERQADAYAAEERWAEAIRERLRGLVANLVDRGLVDNRPGRTASEVASVAGRALPSAAEDLAAAVQIFADVWYGGREASAEQDERMREAASRVAAAHPGDATAAAGASAWGAPE